MEGTSVELSEACHREPTVDWTVTPPSPEQHADIPATAECRICQLTSDIKEMLSPCKCAGSMKYVHIECLEAWRRRSPTNAVRCGVCQSPYSNTRVPPAGLAGALYFVARLQLLFQGDFWRGAGDTHATLLELAIDATPGSSVLRLIVWFVLICVSVMQARILLLVVTIVHEAIIGMDQAIDPLILPEILLNQVYEVFPAVAGFGRMGISNATAEVISELMSGPSVTEINSQIFLIFDTVAQLCDLDALCRPPETLDDLVLGIFILLMHAHLLKQRAPGSPALEALLRVPSPLADVFLLLEFLVPQPDYASAFLVLILPMSAYFGRWILAKFHILPMAAFPIHEHAALHVMLAMLTLGTMVAVSSLQDYISEDFARWYASYTLEPQHALQREEGEARDASVPIAAAPAAQMAPAASTGEASDTATRGTAAAAAQIGQMLEHNAGSDAVATQVQDQDGLAATKKEGKPEIAKQPSEVEHAETAVICKEREEGLQMPAAVAAPAEGPSITSPLAELITTQAGSSSTNDDLQNQENGITGALASRSQSLTKLAAQPEAQPRLLDKIKKLESEHQATAAMLNQHLEQIRAEEDKRSQGHEEKQGAAQDSEEQWCFLTEARNAETVANQDEVFAGPAASSSPQHLQELQAQANQAPEHMEKSFTNKGDVSSLEHLLANLARDEELDG